MTKTTQADAIKFYARRDSATTVLRKLGIKPRDYDFFIEKNEDGLFACQIAKAELHLISLVAKPAFEVGESTEAKPAKSSKPTKKRSDVAKATDTGEVGSISKTARDLILAGKTNQEVWGVLKTEFKLEDSKKHYPTWYRCEMKRKGLLK